MSINMKLMLKFILFLALFLSFNVYAQNISKSDFDKSEWFTSVKGENLFKSDTIVLSKVVDFNEKKYMKLRL